MREESNITEARLKELMHEHIEVRAYDPAWPAMYAAEEEVLKGILPPGLMIRIDHIGSTAVPGLSAKPIVDVQVEVNDLQRVRREVAPKLEAMGYEFIWRPSIGEEAPFYAWFIKRNAEGQRTHHIHMVEPDTASEDRLLFRDHLRTHPGEAARYEALKNALARAHPDDRTAYTLGKTEYVAEVVAKARASV